MAYRRNNRSGWEASARRLQIEAESFAEFTCENYTAAPNGDNIYDWVGVIHGPMGTPYQVWGHISFNLSLKN
jgi:ubiquitin-protein ligase